MLPCPAALLLFLITLFMPLSAAAAARTAAVLGASGAVGTEVVRSLVDSGWQVVVLNRRPVDKFTGVDGVTSHVVNMESRAALESSCEEVMSAAKASALFITMGVGAPSKTKGQAGADILERVDVTLPSACARGAKRAGVKHVSILTAVGADADAKPDTDDGPFDLIPMARAGGPLYNNVKGRVENNLKDLGFSTLSTFRPAALLGTPNTPRFVEIISRILDPVLPAKYKSSDIAVLADAMVIDSEDKLGKAEGASEFDVFEGEVRSFKTVYVRPFATLTRHLARCSLSIICTRAPRRPRTILGQRICNNKRCWGLFKLHFELRAKFKLRFRHSTSDIRRTIWYSSYSSSG